MQPTIEYESTLNTHRALIMLDRRGGTAKHRPRYHGGASHIVNFMLPSQRPNTQNPWISDSNEMSNLRFPNHTVFNFNINPVINTQPAHGGWSNGHQQSDLGPKQVWAKIYKPNIKNKGHVQQLNPKIPNWKSISWMVNKSESKLKSAKILNIKYQQSKH